MCNVKYENITIGTEQELSNVYLLMKNEGSSEQDSKIIVSIYNGTEKLVNVTADTWAGEKDGFDVHQLEFSTTKAGSSDKEAWNQRKEAIKLFVESIVLKEGEEHYKASEFRKVIYGTYATYTCMGDSNDDRIFYFVRKNESAASVRFSNQLTIGIEYTDLVEEFKGKALNDKKGWDMLWLKDCSQELDDPLGVIKTTEEEKFFYSYICSVFDYSVNVYIRMNPNDEDFIDKNRNSSDEKNMWHVLPRSKVSNLLKYFERENYNVYVYFRNRRYNDGVEPDRIKENRIYKTMADKFWEYYDAKNFYNADLLLRAGIIGNTSDHFLFEYRSVLNFIPGIYNDSGMYIYKPDRGLDHMFFGIDNFQQEFPAIYRDIEQKKKQDSAMLKSTTINAWSNAGWQDYESIRMIYNPKEKKLRIKGRVHKTAKADYIMAQMTIQNRHKIINSYKYANTKSTFLLVDEELAVESCDLDGIHAEMKYIFKSDKSPLCLSDRRVETSRIEEVGIDIIGEGKVLHPVSKHGHSKINIIYWREDTHNTADYRYDSTYHLKDKDGKFCIHLPIALQFQLDAGFTLSDTPNINGDIYIYSKNHGTLSFSNWPQVKMIPVSQWKNAGHTYPEINGILNSGYIFVLPQEWNRPIEKGGISGEDDFYLSLDIQFTCQDGKRYSLEIDSQLNPKVYSGGARVEIPCFHLYWGCIEKDAEIEVLGKGRLPISKIQIGEKVLSKDNTYETVCDILTGDEETLKYVRVNGQELMVTMDHPVMTREGWKPARDLREGEQILLQDGNLYPVQEIYDEPYYDKVYSLNLENGEGFFANQIYVGDFNMQNSFKEEDIEIPREIMDELEKFKKL